MRSDKNPIFNGGAMIDRSSILDFYIIADANIKIYIDRFAQDVDKVLAKIGDIDMDGKITNTDADLILRFAILLPPK